MQMKTHPVKVRDKGPDGKVVGSKEVGIATFAEYDSVAEATDTLGEVATLEAINAQVRTNELNRVRGLARPGGISKTALRNKAIAMMTAADWAEVAGNAAAIEAKLVAKMELAKTELEASGESEDND